MVLLKTCVFVCGLSCKKEVFLTPADFLLPFPTAGLVLKFGAFCFLIKLTIPLTIIRLRALWNPSGRTMTSTRLLRRRQVGDSLLNLGQV
jgi:hypothetical protein